MKDDIKLVAVDIDGTFVHSDYTYDMGMPVSAETESGEVSEISVGGDTSFSSGARYEPDAEIIVTYHTFPAELFWKGICGNQRQCSLFYAKS